VRYRNVVAAVAIAVLAAVAPTASAAAADAPRENILQIAFFRHSGLCLWIDASNLNGEDYVQGECNDPSHVEERFQLVRTCSTCQSFYLVNNNGKCMTVASAVTGNGADVNQYTCTAGASNQWLFFDATIHAGYWRIRFAHSGKCAAVIASSQLVGTEVHQWTCGEYDAEALFFRSPLT